ncbi:D-alanine--D-alanine ligase [Candidatus Woesebacteria bacterium]|nr:D-alanine--D-alanine ligase [Candidatus Woesebacteria bacterium]
MTSSKQVEKSLRVAVVMGGPSAEHAISVSSGTEVVRALTQLGHIAVPILITEQQTWHLLDATTLLSTKTSLEQVGNTSLALIPQSQALAPLSGVGEAGVDLVFIAMHGPYGEDGKIQALMELLQLPYTGSGVLASALSMDKVQFRRIMQAEHISIPPSHTFTNENVEEMTSILKNVVGEPPLVVKPSDQGSSIGVSIVHSWKELASAVALARKSGKTILVDRFVKGREFTVGIVGTKEPRVLPVTEIIPDGEFFDYRAKYLSTNMNDICPADISDQLASQLQAIALQVYRAVGATGFARVDFIVDEKDMPVVLEINTIPGLTPVSLLPIAAKAAGLSFAELIQEIALDALS